MSWSGACRNSERDTRRVGEWEHADKAGLGVSLRSHSHAPPLR